LASGAKMVVWCGGGSGQCRGWRPEEGSQRVVMTRWGSFDPAMRVEEVRNQPTSHNDSLVVVVGDVEGGGIGNTPTSLEDSLVVVP